MALPPEAPTPKIAPLLFAMLTACGVAAAIFYVAIRWLARHHPHEPQWVIVLSLAYGAAIMGFVTVFARRVRRLTCPGGAATRHGRRVMIAMWIYVFALLAASWAFSQHLPAPLLYGLVLLTILPLLAVIWAMLRYIDEETDEFQRTLMLQSAFWGTAGLLAVATTWGFLQFFQLAPTAPLFLAFPLWCGIMGLARAMLARRYR
ncbi:MAG: hypothetical protein JWM33_1433 [Caulobacteraceae bacterium]|nr:hypothetical protein [Caulobacteraceae bacterium]